MSFFHKKVISAAFLFICSLSSICYAQTEPAKDSEEFYANRFVDFSIDRVLPLNTFKEGLDRKLWGFTFAFLKQRESDNIDYFGLQINYANIGTEEATIFDEDLKTGTNHFSAHFVYRLYPDFYIKKIEPFMEVTLGPQAFYTVTTTTFIEDQSNNVDFDRFDMGMSYGVNLGLTIHYYKQAFVFLKAGYYGGTSISYLVNQEDGFLAPIEAFNLETSQTNNVRFNFGLAISF